ncbi:MAG: hypothetical protein Q8918_14165 [Bacteroidota bacterium]|nr:hypothetical protein [Bacteroidota bacterium]MDP4251247.1 hypothetical protein [Bacteroidota bacterium]
MDKSILPEKVLLSGSDCFHRVLDKHAHTHRSGGNVMRIVFYFNTRLPADKIKKTFSDSPLIYWLCNIKLQKGPPFGIPCWRYRDKGNEMVINEYQHAVPNELPEIILQRDISLDGERFIEADIIYYSGNKTAFVLSWNHILMDVKGIGMLIHHLNELNSGNEDYEITLLFPAQEKKTGLFSHIKNMYSVKRFIEASSKAPIASIAGKNARSVVTFKNRILYFTAEETDTINEHAIQNGARLGDNPFYLSCCCRAVNNVLKQRQQTGTLWIPIPYDGRLKGSLGPVISNTVAFIFYRVPEKALANMKETVACFSSQMTGQIKEKMPRKYGLLLNLMRRIPLRLYYFLVNRSGEGSFASFLYSSAGETFNGLKTLFGETVSGLTIFPSPTFPPGLTFSFQKHREALNINMAYSPDIVDNPELHKIERDLKHFLLGINE